MLRFLAVGLVFALCSAAAPAIAGEVHVALNEGNTERAIALLKENPKLIESLSDMDETPLHVAAHRGRVNAVKWLLENKAQVNLGAYNTFTPLHLTESGEIARMLIKAGANLSLKDSWGNTPLQMAADEGHLAVVAAILESGYPLDLRSAILVKNRDLVKKMLRDEPTLAAKKAVAHTCTEARRLLESRVCKRTKRSFSY